MVFNRETFAFIAELPLSVAETGHFFVRFASGAGQKMPDDELRAKLKCRVRVGLLLAWIQALLDPNGRYANKCVPTANCPSQHCFAQERPRGVSTRCRCLVNEILLCFVSACTGWLPQAHDRTGRKVLGREDGKPVQVTFSRFASAGCCPHSGRNWRGRGWCDS